MAVQYCICQIAYKYMRYRPEDAQLVCFMLLGNDRIREMYSHLYDDAFVGFYLTLAFYFFIFGRVYVAAVFLSLSLSVKTGVLVALPALVGTIQWLHGSLPLAGTLGIVVGGQLLLAQPLVNPIVAAIFGFASGANTSLQDYLARSHLVPGLLKDAAHRACDFESSILWKVLGKVRCDWHIKTVTSAQLLFRCNAYYFFGRRKCWVECLSRFGDSFRGKTNWNQTFKQFHQKVEMVLVLFVIGANLVSGAPAGIQLTYA